MRVNTFKLGKIIFKFANNTEISKIINIIFEFIIIMKKQSYFKFIPIITLFSTIFIGILDPALFNVFDC